MRKLSDLERDLIGVVLDYEKEHLNRSYRIADAAGLDRNGVVDLIPFKRLEESLKLNGRGDLSTEVIYGYTRGEYSIESVYELVEYILNDDLDKIEDWFVKYEQA